MHRNSPPLNIGWGAFLDMESYMKFFQSSLLERGSSSLLRAQRAGICLASLLVPQKISSVEREGKFPAKEYPSSPPSPLGSTSEVVLGFRENGKAGKSRK